MFTGPGLSPAMILTAGRARVDGRESRTPAAGCMSRRSFTAPRRRTRTGLAARFCWRRAGTRRRLAYWTTSTPHGCIDWHDESPAAAALSSRHGLGSGRLFSGELVWVRHLDWPLLRRADPQEVAERVAQAAVGAVEALGRLLGELDALGDQLVVGLADVVHRDDRRHAHRALGHQLADLLGRRLVVRRRAGPLQQQLPVGLTREVNRQPAHETEIGVGVQLEPQLPDIEVERLVLVEHVNLCMSDRVWHEGEANARAVPWLLQNCSVSSMPLRSRPGRP